MLVAFQVPSIQQSAALALGRLANYSDDLAEAVVGNEILPQLVYSLSEQNRYLRQRNSPTFYFNPKEADDCFHESRPLSEVQRR